MVQLSGEGDDNVSDHFVDYDDDIIPTHPQDLWFASVEPHGLLDVACSATSESPERMRSCEV